jgi:hypothetical protein
MFLVHITIDPACCTGGCWFTLLFHHNQQVWETQTDTTRLVLELNLVLSLTCTSLVSNSIGYHVHPYGGSPWWLVVSTICGHGKDKPNIT